MLKADYDAEFRVSKYKEDGDEAVMAVGVVWKWYLSWVLNHCDVYSCDI